MDNKARRQRSTTTASNGSPIDEAAHSELRECLAKLTSTHIHITTDKRPTIDELQSLCDSLHRIRQCLVNFENRSHAKDAFRRLHGFQALLAVLASLSGYYSPTTLTKDEEKGFFELLKATLDVLSEALHNQPGNRRYFARRVGGNGWLALEKSLANTGVNGTNHSGEDEYEASREQFFSCLLAHALGEEVISRIFRSFSRIRQSVESSNLDSKRENIPPRNEVTKSNSSLSEENDAIAEPLAAIRSQLRMFLSGTEVVQNPETIPMIFNFWQTLAVSPESRSAPSRLRLAILVAVEQVLSHSTYNQVMIHRTGILSSILPVVFDQELPSSEKTVLHGIADILAAYGVNKLEDGYYLFKKASTSGAAAEFLLKSIQTSRQPPFIQFDLSLHGHSSIELRDLGRPFPPSSSSAGYTMTAWIRIDQFDPTCHTTIFGACDATQSCFVLAYLERDSHHFILQTSITAQRPSVRFKSTVFKAGIWYHIAVVHRRPKATSSSRATLFVNGEFTEQLKCQYPASPPIPNSSTESFASLSSPDYKYPPVQAFLGTPQDLAPRIGRNVVSSKLSLASFHLFQDALSDEVIAVHQKLGPRYYGNFQDCLGSFQTYRDSAQLNILNESLHPGKEEKSEIISAIHSKAGFVLPENRILLSISPSMVMDDDDRDNIDESQLIKSLSKAAAKNLQHLTKASPIVINGAVPSINDALTHSRGVALLLGDPVVAVPQSLDDASWRIAGCAAVGLKLVEVAQGKDAILRAVNLLFQSVEGSWRNSEAMEKETGYAVLASLLSEKMGLGSMFSNKPILRSDQPQMDDAERDALAHELLRNILRFVGYCEARPEESTIINPLAYRVLLVDFDMWRRTSADTQKLYYSQFVSFAKGSKHHLFNSRRLTRMRVVKRFLDALKGESFAPDVLSNFLEAFKVLVECNVSGDILRSLALFITYALHDSRAFGRRTLRPKSSTLRMGNRPTPPQLSPVLLSPRPESPIQYNGISQDSREELGIKVLGMYTDLLCESSSTNNLRKFAKAVTNKWLLYLLAENEPRVVVLGTKILARLLVVLGGSYVKKFAEKTGGFIVMKQRLKTWWSIPAIWTLCFAVLTGVDVATIDVERDFDLPNLMASLFGEGRISVANPEIVSTIMAMLETGLRVVEQMAEYAGILHTVLEVFTNLHLRSQEFRDFAVSSSYVQELLFVLFPVTVASDPTNATTELHSRGPASSFEGQDIINPPQSDSIDDRPSLVRIRAVEREPNQASRKPAPLRRGSSFILVSSQEANYAPSTARIKYAISTHVSARISPQTKNPLPEVVLATITAVFLDQIFHRKDFPGFGLFLKVPPGSQSHQAQFETYILRHAMSAVTSYMQLHQNLLCEPRIILNLARYTVHMAEAVFEGWFIDGAEPLLDFIGTLLDFLQRPDIARTKGELGQEQDTVAFMDKLVYWQTIVLAPDNADETLLRLLCYLLYTQLVVPQERIRLAAANFWRMILVQKPEETSQILNQAMSSHHKKLSLGFMKLTELDNETFLEWVDEHREDLDAFFFGTLSKAGEPQDFGDSTKQSCKEKERLKQWQADEANVDNVWHRHEISTNHWRVNIHTSERLKHQRALQDQQDNLGFIASRSERLDKILQGPCGLFGRNEPSRWQLDETEGRNRMRMRIMPDDTSHDEAEYQPKRKASEVPAKPQPKLDTNIRRVSSNNGISATPVATQNAEGASVLESGRQRSNSQLSAKSAAEEDFEMVDDPQVDDDGFEDKYRKVMRSLEPNDPVQLVCNVSRIVGLEAIEGLLIVGKGSLYLLDTFFQRSDGEIVRVWQAPNEERDPYLRMISGREMNNKKPQVADHEQSNRHWKWAEVISISKRRFLFRNVALEVFFTDGRSYLLTALNPQTRNDLYTKLVNRAPHVNSVAPASHSEDSWRLESLRHPEEAPQSLSSKWANVFSSASSNPATRKWLKGEISNFHYLMLINTMAGRTFNDLTQYPVFPWVIADYTSDELDLTNERTFRDLSKPMGCQTASRESDFRDRYKSFAEMGDHNSPPFHYGTHYSSAMIVTSYLIRLQPFVQSYLLLQGGNFDHADRLFSSIEKTWLLASRESMTDVRELTPEFFYLPEFLKNINSYNFGNRQSGGKVDDVELPPWAKGDPEIFIAKNREALESPYVSKNLHQWIDLVFGFKQSGDAAIEATNVFHHLSYHGAKDLDQIDDPMERLATIGIIHNFGQTPHQVFQRAHPQRKDVPVKSKRLDDAAESLTQLPSFTESQDRVSSLLYSPKQDKVLVSGAFRLNIPPNYERYMEWGFADGSVRFYAADSKKLLGLFEHLHQSQISCATFVDSKTLITAGTDCVISVWTISAAGKAVDLQPRICHFGHRTPVTTLAACRPFSTFVSASTDGKVYLWDLNRSEFIRELELGDGTAPVQCARINGVTGHVMLCAGSRVLLYTLNGRLLLDQRVCETEEPDDVVASCAFYEGAGNEWVSRELMFTGHRRGVVNVWNKTISGSGEWRLELVKRLDHVDTAREGALNFAAPMTCILPLPTVVYTGDEEGRVFQWECSQRQ
ncbi:beige protein-like 1 [Coniosporium tulheliwenetii]|uniref:Beige protein-like 1 n=1 Tax=Coniosporium tulheliwenetii TaxID=3383036 RepID=A0ACC2ZDL4_9PEZI|nr:beige protein-like 1 [Cladosporium sp. JES 115]